MSYFPVYNLSIVVLFWICSASTTNPLVLPPLLGPHSVGTRRVQVVDGKRVDPFAPTCQNCAPVLTLWYPIESNDSLTPAPWLPSKVAAIENTEFGIPEGTLETLITQTFINGSAIFPLVTNNTLPVLVFSPGSEGLSAYYTTILSSLTSYGYSVIGVDHPYDSWPLERLNGELVMYGNTTHNISFASIVRRDDLLFLGRQLEVSDISQWLETSIDGVDNIKLGVFGQSLGGNAGNLAMQDKESPYMASASLDGSFFYPLNVTGFRGPLLYIAASDLNLRDILVEEWPLIKDWKLAIEINASVHISFSDLVVLKYQRPEWDEVDVGNIDGNRMIEILVDYLKDFWDCTLLEKEQSGLLRKESALYPEISFLDLDTEARVDGFLRAQERSSYRQRKQHLRSLDEYTEH